MLERPERLIAIAVVLLFFGVAMPFLMVIHVVESTFFLNFLSFGASVLGLFLGITGVAVYRAKQTRRNDDENHYR